MGRVCRQITEKPRPPKPIRSSLQKSRAKQQLLRDYICKKRKVNVLFGEFSGGGRDTLGGATWRRFENLRCRAAESGAAQVRSAPAWFAQRPVTPIVSRTYFRGDSAAF